MKRIENTTIVLLAILLINTLFLVYVAFIKKDTTDLEAMKVGGKENFKIIEKLYNHPGYVSEQKKSIQQGLDTFGIQ